MLMMVLIFLVLTALVDILGGNEPQSALGGEYLVVLTGVPVIVLLGWYLRKQRN